MLPGRLPGGGWGEAHAKSASDKNLWALINEIRLVFFCFFLLVSGQRASKKRLQLYALAFMLGYFDANCVN